MSNQFQIDKIIQEDVINGKPHYLVKWKGYGSMESTWEPIQNLIDQLDLVHRWKVKTSRENMRRKRQQSQTIKQINDEVKLKKQYESQRQIRRKRRQENKFMVKDFQSNQYQEKSQSEQQFQQQTNQIGFMQPFLKDKQGRKLRYKNGQGNSYKKLKKMKPEDQNSFRKIGKITKNDLKCILANFDWQNSNFCQVLLEDGRKVHMKSQDLKKICPQILLQYYQNIVCQERL